MDERSVLIELGLTDSEAIIYLALLEQGSSLVGPIIKKTGLHRATTYQILERLKEKGLVSSIIIEKKQHFAAVSPNEFLTLLKEKEEQFQEVLPKLLLKQSLAKETQHVTVYSGVKGLRTVFDQMLDELGTGGVYYDFGVSGMFKDIMGPYFYTWQRKKKEKHMRPQVIFNKSVKEKNPEILKEYVGEYKFHKDDSPSMTDTFIYNDIVVLCIWTAKPPVAIVIKNKDNAQSYLNQFKMMWKGLKK
ncbi:MAG: helix-turn-helix domain-containing protein [Candidatus Woesearchaeota archaeon]